MGNQLVSKVIVTDGTNVPNNAVAQQIAMVNPDGTVASTVKPQTKPADSVASTVGALVTDFNSLLALLKTAGVLK